MFELDQEVAAWSEGVYEDRCRRARSVAELSDHLYCEIERARAKGLSDEQAFAAAVERVGTARELAAEDAKGRTLLQTACAAAARYDRAGGGRGRGLLVANGILWAAVMLAASLALKMSSQATFGWLMFAVLMPSWWASELILRRALRARPASASGA